MPQHSTFIVFLYHYLGASQYVPISHFTGLFPSPSRWTTSSKDVHILVPTKYFTYRYFHDISDAGAKTCKCKWSTELNGGIWKHSIKSWFWYASGSYRCRRLWAIVSISTNSVMLLEVRDTTLGRNAFGIIKPCSFALGVRSWKASNCLVSSNTRAGISPRNIWPKADGFVL